MIVTPGIVTSEIVTSGIGIMEVLVLLIIKVTMCLGDAVPISTGVDIVMDQESLTS